MRIYSHLISTRVWNEYWAVKTFYEGLTYTFPGIADNAAYLRQRPDLIKNMAKWVRRLQCAPHIC